MFCIVLAYSYLCTMKQLLSIFLLLVALCCCTTEADRNRMRAGLDSINVLNRNDQPFTVQDVKPYVQFFDDHGTPNDRLLAHYLLGRAYHEAGEAPMALECYQKAAECADTLSKDCDYAQLCRVYAQMADIFYYQNLYRQQLTNKAKASRLAWKANDTITALICHERKYLAYKGLGYPDSAIYIIENVAKLYDKYGYASDAAIALGAIVRTLIDRGDYQKAKTYMDRYESKSGLFDSLGNIEKGREVYYKAKGLYYLYINKSDSAEYYFRKELRDGKDFNNQNAAAMGLALLFQHQHYSDSAANYSIYAYAMSDSMYAQKATYTVERMQAMYDYSRHQKEAQLERENATRRTIIIWICIAVIVFICVITFIIIRELTHRRLEAERKYIHSLEIIEQARYDIVKLRNSEETNKELISEKEQTIHDQEIILKSLLHKDVNSHSLADKKLKETDIYLRYERLSTIGQTPTDEEWSLLLSQISMYYPGFHDFMQEHDFHLSDEERKICLLLRIGFKPTIIANMIGVTSSYITELRTKMLQKLFGLSGNSKSFDKILREIY